MTTIPESSKKRGMDSDILVLIVVLTIIAGLIAFLVYGAIHYLWPAVQEQGKSVRVDTVSSAVARPPVPLPPASPAGAVAIPPDPEPIPASTGRGPGGAKPVPAPSVAAAQRTEEFTLTGFDVRHARLAVPSGATARRVDLDLGSRLVPVAGSNGCVYVLTESVHVVVDAGAPAATVYPGVVGLDFSRFHAPVAGAEFRVEAPAPGGSLHDFLRTAVAQTSAWNVVQTGAWVLENNISRRELEGVQLRIADPAVVGGVRVEPMATFRDVKRVERFVSMMGLDPDAYRLFVEEREARNQLVAQLDFDRPAANWLALLKSKAPARYVGDTEIERLMLQYAARHRRADARQAAVEILVSMGVSGDRSALYARALWMGDPLQSFLSSLALVNRGDTRVLPIAAVWADDAGYGPLSRAAVEAAIATTSGQTRQSGEPMLGYWIRVVGWEGLAKSGRETERIRPALEGYEKRMNLGLAEALGDIVSADEQKAIAACHRLSQLQRNGQAFDVLCRTAMPPRPENLRVAALSALGAFRDFSPAAVCEPILRHESVQLIRAAMNLINRVQYVGFENALILAARNESPVVRRQAAETMGMTKALEGEAMLVQLARHDGDPGVQDAALRALTALRSPEALALLEGLMRTGERENKARAVNGLIEWEGDAQAVGILQKYRRDAEVGSRIEAQLQRLGQ